MNEARSAFSVYSQKQDKAKKKKLQTLTPAKLKNEDKKKKRRLSNHLKNVSSPKSLLIIEDCKKIKEIETATNSKSLIVNGKPKKIKKDNRTTSALINGDSKPKKIKLKSKEDNSLLKKQKIKDEDGSTKVKKEKIPKLINSLIEEADNNSEVIIERELIEASNDYTHKAVKLLKWLLFPLKLKNFFENYWEMRHIHIKRDISNYYNHILSSDQIDVMLREHPLYFGRNVDIVMYDNDVRETINPVGRARASIVWDAYSSGHSIRILNPQTYNKNVQIVLSALQEYFGAMVGANVYLTPAGSQGFAPHYDDIEAFVIQLEGRKHWKLYQPRANPDTLARYSSEDFKRENLGELIAELTLNAGDILYFPRGIVHEAKTDDESHSLHITISTYQKTAFADLMEKLLPDALATASSVDIEFRKGLPIGYLKHLGVVNAENNSPKRDDLIDNIKRLFNKLENYIDIDKAADQLGRKFMHEAVPPVLDNNEVVCTSEQDGDQIDNGEIINKTEMEPDTEIRLLRYYSIRLVIENDQANLYFSTQNSKVYHGEEEQFMSIDFNMCPVVEYLQHSYPEYVKVENLPHDDISKKVGFITELWDYGIIVTKNPLIAYDV